jgi:hypothetical protein
LPAGETFVDKHKIFFFAFLLTGATGTLHSASQQRGQIPGSVAANNTLSKAQNNRSSQGQPTVDPSLPTPAKQALEKNAQEIKTEVARLYELASDLKTEVDKTDTTKVLSTSLTKKAQEIEKLAKDIKSRSKG